MNPRLVNIFFMFWETPSSDQGSLCAQGSLLETSGDHMWGIETSPAMCKANALPALISLQLQDLHAEEKPGHLLEDKWEDWRENGKNYKEMALLPLTQKQENWRKQKGLYTIENFFVAKQCYFAHPHKKIKKKPYKAKPKSKWKQVSGGHEVQRMELGVPICKKHVF